MSQPPARHEVMPPSAAHALRTDEATPAALLHTFRRFGEYGPVYQIVDVREVADAVRPALTIKVIATGEVVRYDVGRALADPVAD